MLAWGLPSGVSGACDNTLIPEWLCPVKRPSQDPGEHRANGINVHTSICDLHPNRFYRHVAIHWIEMQQALIAMLIGGVFEFHPKLRVGFLEAQNSWVPGLLSRIEWDYPQYRDSHAPYLTLMPREYFRRNCWAAVEGSEPEIEATAGLIGADRMCISTD